MPGVANGSGGKAMTHKPKKQPTLWLELRCLVAEILMYWALRCLPPGSDNEYAYAKCLLEYTKETQE